MFTVKVIIKILFRNGPIDDGSISKRVEPLAVFNRTIHVDKAITKRVSNAISFENVENLSELICDCGFDE